MFHKYSLRNICRVYKRTAGRLLRPCQKIIWGKTEHGYNIDGESYMGCGEGPRLSQRAILSRTITNEKEKKKSRKNWRTYHLSASRRKGSREQQAQHSVGLINTFPFKVFLCTETKAGKYHVVMTNFALRHTEGKAHSVETQKRKQT